MATAVTPHAGEIKFVYNRPETLALKFLEPKVFDGSFGPRAMFTVCDEGYGERKIWLDYEHGRNIVDELRRLKIRAGEPIRLIKIKHAHGGGSGFLVYRADASTADAAPAAAHQVPPAWVTNVTPEQAPAEAVAPSDIEAQLAQSVAMVKTHGRGVFRQPPAPVMVEPAEPSPERARFMLAYKDAIDVLLDARAYAQHKGLALEVRCEDVRCLAATIMIDQQRGGR